MTHPIDFRSPVEIVIDARAEEIQAWAKREFSGLRRAVGQWTRKSKAKQIG